MLLPLGLAVTLLALPAMGQAPLPGVTVGGPVVALASLVPVAGLLVSLFVWFAACGLTARGLSSRRAGTGDLRRIEDERKRER